MLPAGNLPMEWTLRLVGTGIEKLFVGSTSPSVRCRLQLPVELHAVLGKATIEPDHHYQKH